MTSGKHLSLLMAEFEMKILGDPAYMLGVHIKRDRITRVLTLDQTQYITDILHKFGMQDSHGVATPIIALGVKLEKPTQPATAQEQKELDKIPYRQAIGSLIFLACLTRPDLAYAVHLTSQYMSYYRQDH